MYIAAAMIPVAAVTVTATPMRMPARISTARSDIPYTLDEPLPGLPGAVVCRAVVALQAHVELMATALWASQEGIRNRGKDVHPARLPASGSGYGGDAGSHEEPTPAPLESPRR